MDEIIKINYDNNKTTVLGRDLYRVLEVETPYTIWIKRMMEYGFIENEDFITFLLESTGGRPSENHQLTIEMAKEICMLQRSEKGKRVRLYFIECERKLKEKGKVLPQNYKEALLCLVEAEEERERLQIERDTAIKTKSQISRKREATVMGKLSQLTRKYNKLTNNEQQIDEYTAMEVASITGVFSKNGNPHSQMVSAFFNSLKDKVIYGRNTKEQLATGQIVDCMYFNGKFIKRFIKFLEGTNEDRFYYRGKSYKFERLSY